MTIQELIDRLQEINGQFAADREVVIQDVTSMGPPTSTDRVGSYQGFVEIQTSEQVYGGE